MTMVGSSPLILLNDLILTANEGLPEEMKMEPFSLFSVAPIGAALIATGILYFLLLGRWVLPGSSDPVDVASGHGTSEYLERVYGLHAQVFAVEQV